MLSAMCAPQILRSIYYDVDYGDEQGDINIRVWRETRRTLRTDADSLPREQTFPEDHAIGSIKKSLIVVF